MQTYQLTLKLNSAFGTPLVGDSLFGQCCWAIVHQFGEQRLNDLLNDYEQQPFMVISDAFPKGYLPLPTLPSMIWETPKDEQGNELDRKVLKKKQWIALEYLSQPVQEWQKLAKDNKDITFQAEKHSTLHNTINRQTQTTGEDQFAPYSTEQTWYKADTEVQIYVLIDENRIAKDDVEKLFENIGKFGYGRDASTGLGKFEITGFEQFQFTTQANANAYFTLANCAPQGLALVAEQSFYQITTRFGRHGDIKALGSNPFKKPIILAKAGAIFKPQQWQNRLFLGNGLTQVSYAQDRAVHQGYAPVIGLNIPFEKLGGNND